MTILYFAWVRQKIGRGEEEIVLPPQVKTVADLAAHLSSHGPGYADVFANRTTLRAAVDQIHVGFDADITRAQEIAFFPPVTGG